MDIAQLKQEQERLNAKPFNVQPLYNTAEAQQNLNNTRALYEDTYDTPQPEGFTWSGIANSDKKLSTINENIRYSDPNRARQRNLRVATAHAKQRLDGSKQWQEQENQRLYDLGLDAYSIQEQEQENEAIRTIPIEDRIDNYERRKQGDFDNTFDDFELTSDFNNLTYPEIEGKYGKVASDYLNEKSKQEYALKAQANSQLFAQTNPDVFSLETAQNVGASLIRKSAETVGGLADIADYAINGREALERQNKEGGALQSVIDWSNAQTSNSFQQEAVRSNARDIDSKNVENAQRERNIRQGQSVDNASTNARLQRHLDGASSILDEKGHLVTGAVEIGADLATLGLGAGAVGRGAGAITKQVAKRSAKSAKVAKASKVASKAEEEFAKRELQGITTDVAKADAKALKSSRAVSDTKFKGVSDEPALAKTSVGNKVVDKPVTSTVSKTEQGANTALTQAEREAITTGARDKVSGSELVSKVLKEEGFEVRRQAARKYLKKTAGIKDKTRSLEDRIADQIAHKVAINSARATATVAGSNMEAIDALRSGYSNIKDLDDSTFLNTPEGKKLTTKLAGSFGLEDKPESIIEALKSNKELREKYNDEKSKLAEDVAINSYIKVFGVSAITQALTSHTELKIAGLEKRKEGYFKSILKDTLKETVGQELPESVAGEVLPKYEANIALQSNVYDTTENIGKVVGQTLITAGLGVGGIASVSNISKTKPALSKIRNKLGKALKIDPNTEAKDSISNPVNLVRERTEKAYDIASQVAQGTATEEQKEELTKERESIIQEYTDQISTLTKDSNTVYDVSESSKAIDLNEAEKDMDDGDKTAILTAYNATSKFRNVEPVESFDKLTSENKKDFYEWSKSEEVDSYLESTQSTIDALQSEQIQHTINLDNEGANVGRKKFYNMFIGSENEANVKALSTDDNNIELIDSDGNKQTYSKRVVVDQLIRTIGAIDTTAVMDDDYASAIKNVKNAIDHVSNLIDLAGYTNSNKGLKALSKGLNKIVERINAGKLSPTEAKTVYEQMIGSKQNKGLINYAQEAIRNNGSLSPKSKKLLDNFIASQRAKVDKVKEAIEWLEQNGSDIPNRKINVGIKNQDGEEIAWSYNDLPKAKNYSKAVASIMDQYNQLADSIANGEFAPKEKHIRKKRRNSGGKVLKQTTKPTATAEQESQESVKSTESVSKEVEQSAQSNEIEEPNIDIDSLFNLGSDEEAVEKFTETEQEEPINIKDSDSSSSEAHTDDLSKETEDSIDIEKNAPTIEYDALELNGEAKESTSKKSVEPEKQEIKESKPEESDTVKITPNPVGAGLYFIGLRQDNPAWKPKGDNTDVVIKHEGKEHVVSRYAYLELAKRGLDLLNPISFDVAKANPDEFKKPIRQPLKDKKSYEIALDKAEQGDLEAILDIAATDLTNLGLDSVFEMQPLADRSEIIIEDLVKNLKEITGVPIALSNDDQYRGGNSVEVALNDVSFRDTLFYVYHEAGHKNGSILSNFLSKPKYINLMNKLAQNPFITELFKSGRSQGYKSDYARFGEVEAKALRTEEILNDILAANLSGNWGLFAKRYNITEDQIPAEFKRALSKSHPLKQLWDLITDYLGKLLNKKDVSNEDVLAYLDITKDLRSTEYHGETWFSGSAKANPSTNPDSDEKPTKASQREIVKFADDYLASKISEHFDKYVPTILTPKKTVNAIGINGLLNFATVNKNRTLTIHPKIQEGMRKAIMQSIVKSKATTKANIEVLEESLGVNADLLEVTQEAGAVQLNYPSVYDLGTHKDLFVKELGEAVLKSSGLKLNVGKNSYQHSAIAQSLGVEAYNLMTKFGLVVTTKLTGEGINNKQGIQYVQHAWFTSGKENLKPVNFGTTVKQNLVGELVKEYSGEQEQLLKGTLIWEEGEEEPSFDKTGTSEQEFSSNANTREYTRSYSNQVWKVDNNFYDLLEENEDFFNYAVGAKADLKESETEAYKNELAKMGALARQVESLKETLKNSLVDRQKARFKFQYFTTAVSRLMDGSELSPQAHKIVRELLTVQQAIVSNPDYVDTFKIDSTDSIYGLVNQVSKLLEDKTAFNIDSLEDKAKLKNATAISFVMGIAQALGSKIEKNTYADIIKGFPTLLEKPVIADMLNTLRTKSYDKEVAKKFYKEFGSSAPRALKALHSIVQFENSNENYTPTLFLEADGITNGFHNIFMQFGLMSDSKYAENLAITGYTTPEFMEDSNYSEGSANINKIAKDLYQQIADSITDEINDTFAITLSNKNNFIKETDNTAQLSSKLDEINYGKLDDNGKQLYKATRKVANLIGSLSLLGEFSVNNKSLVELSLAEIRQASVDKIASAISRSFSKLGVTPKGYSAGLKGVNNQLSKQVVSSLNSQIFELTQDYNKDTAHKVLLALSSLGIKTTRIANKSISIDKLSDAVASNTVNPEFVIMGLNNVVKYNKKQLMQSSLDISRLLNEATDARVSLTLSASSATLAMIEPLTNNFVKNITGKIKTAIDERNIKYGWVDDKGEILNVEAYAGLSKKDLREILRNESSLPVIANAFSYDESLLEDLTQLGSTLIKTKLNNINGLSGSISSLYGNEYYNNGWHLDTYLINKVKEYLSAGASAFTSTVISTEGKAQADTRAEMEKLGISGLNVYDGGDAFAWISAYMGNALNRNLLKAHKNYSIIGAFLDMYQRGELQNIGKNLESNTKFLTDYQHFIDTKEMTPSIQQFASLVSGLNQGLTELDSLGFLNYYSQDPVLNSLSLQFKPNYQGEIISPNTVKLMLENREFTNLINDYLHGLQNLGAERQATQEFLSNSLGQYDAFGGASRGVQLNQDNELAKQVFDEFLSSESKSYIAVANINEKLRDKIHKARIEFREQHPLVDGLGENTLKAEDTTLDELISKLELKGSTLVGKMQKALLNMAGNLKNIKVRFDTSANNSDLHGGGYFDTKTNTIVLNKDVFDNLSPNKQRELIFHELTHSILANNLHAYFNKGKLNNAQKQAIQGIIEQAQGFIRTGLQLANVKQGIALNTGDLGVLLKNGLGLEASLITSLNYAFNAPKENLTEQQIADVQEEALHEFIAYSFTNPDLINKHYNRKATGVNNENSVLNRFRKAITGLIDKVKNLVSKTLGLTREDSRLNALLEHTFALQLAGTAPKANVSRKFSNVFIGDYDTTLEAMNEYTSEDTSDNFKDYLAKLISDSSVGNQEVLSTFNYEEIEGKNFNYDRAAEAHIHANKSNRLHKILSYVRSTGLSVSPLEAQAFVTMYPLVSATNTSASGKQAIANFLAQNKELLTELPQAQLDKLNKSKKLGIDPISVIVSLALTNEKLHTSLNAELNRKALLSGYITPKEFASNLAQFEYRATVTGEQREQLRIKRNQQRALQNKILKGLKTKFGSVGAFVEAVAIAEESGPNGEHTFINNFINGLAQRSIRKNGKPTWFSSLIDLILGERANTHDIADWHNEAIMKTATYREGIVTTAKIALSEAFKRDLEDDERSALAKGLTENNGIYLAPKVSKQVFTSILGSEQERSNLSSQIQDKLRNKVINLSEQNGVSLQEAKQIYNYLVWQSKGLGDLLTLNQAKSANVKGSHGILSNARAITSLSMLKGTGLDKYSDIFHKPEVQDLVRQLSSVESVKNLNEETKLTLTNLANEDYKSLVDFSKQSQEVIANNLDTGSLLGHDGVTARESDSLYGLQLVHPTDEATINHLEHLGYVEHSQLPSGELVFYSNGVKPRNFTVGMFGLTEVSNQGVDSVSYRRTGSQGLSLEENQVDSIKKNLNGVINNALNSDTYYDSLSTNSAYKPIINEHGNVVGVDAELPSIVKDELIPNVPDGIEAVAKYLGRVAEQKAVQVNNRKMLQALNDKFNNDFDRSNYAIVTKDLNIVNAKSEYAKKLEAIIQRLPKDTKDYIKEHGLAIPLFALNNSLGYNLINYSDFFSDSFKPDNQAVKVVRSALDGVIRAFNGNPTKVANWIHTYISQVASFGKETILMRSVVVPTANALSNVIHLLNKGVPVQDIIKGTRDTLVEVKRYQQNQNQISINEFKLNNSQLNPDERRKLQLETELLKKVNQNSNLYTLIQAGLLSSITTLEAPYTNINRYTLRNKLIRSVGLDSTIESAPRAVKEALMFKDSSSYKYMKDFMDYGDFVAKAVLAKHYASQGMDSKTIINEVREEFVDYSRNRGALFDVLNETGMTWFLAYKLGIAKVIARTVVRNPIRTAAVLALGNGITSTVPYASNLIQLVPEQLLSPANFLPFMSYQTNPTNLINGVESHYLLKGLNAVF